MSSASPFIGIDFGTSKSCMAWYNPDTGAVEIIRNEEGEENTPSVVYFGENETLVGSPAEDMLQDQKERQRVITGVKRDLVGAALLALGRLVKPVEAVAEILGKLKRDAEERHFNKQPITGAVITYPGAFDELQQEKIQEAGKLAGFSKVEVLAEPVAAALAYQQAPFKVGDHVLVYDLGAGTFDLALLVHDDEQLFRLALPPKSIGECGGDKFDRALYEHCDGIAQQEFGRPMPDPMDLQFLRECRQRKEVLSHRTQTTFGFHLPTEPGMAFHFTHTLEQAKFEELISKHIEETVRLTKEMLTEATQEDITVDTVVLIGGSARIPLVERLLKEALPVEPQKWHLQDMAVALGAAYYAHHLWGKVVSQITVSPDGSGLTLKEAIEAIAEGGTIRLTAGTHRLTRPLLIEKSVRLIGASMDATAIVGDGEQYLVKFAGPGKLEAEGITFRHEGTTWADVLVATGAEINLANCRFTGGVSDEQAKRGGNGLLLSARLKGQVSHCRMEDNQIHGISIRGQAQPQVEANICQRNKQNGILYSGHAGGIVHKNECVDNQQNGICVEEQAQPSIKKNKCWKNKQSGIYYIGTASGVAHNNECIRNQKNGIYVGEEAKPELLRNSCQQNKQSGISYYGSAKGVARDNRCVGNRSRGIYVGQQAQPRLEKNLCQNNKQSGIRYYDRASGVACDNRCVGNQSRGIYVGQQAQPRLLRNTCRENKESGISYRHSARGVAHKNECVGNQKNGIYVGQQAKPELKENICKKNERAGIRIDETANPDLSNNDCLDNKGRDVDDKRKSL